MKQINDHTGKIIESTLFECDADTPVWRGPDGSLVAATYEDACEAVENDALDEDAIEVGTVRDYWPDNLTTQQAAAALDISPRAVLQAIERGDIQATKYGTGRRGTWLIPTNQIKKYKTAYRKPGRKPAEREIYYISINNDRACTPEEAIKQMGWDTIVNAMDNDIRERAHMDAAPCDNLTFLKEYLKHGSIVIG